MGVDHFLKQFPDYKVTRRQLAFARYLEQQGYVFLIEFGFENAEKIAWQTCPSTPQ